MDDVWSRVDVDVSEEQSFEVHRSFGVDVIRRGTNLAVLLDNYSGQKLVFEFIGEQATHEDENQIIEVDFGSLGRKVLPSKIQRVTFFWRKV